jgi:hypothetical protein
MVAASLIPNMTLFGSQPDDFAECCAPGERRGIDAPGRYHDGVEKPPHHALRDVE